MGVGASSTTRLYLRRIDLNVTTIYYFNKFMIFFLTFMALVSIYHVVTGLEINFFHHKQNFAS